MIDLVKEIEERKLKAFHIFIATLLGKLAESGFLNQGALNTLIPAVSEK